MAKRVADREINQDNYDQDIEKEEPGLFEKADGNILKDRKILVPSRKFNATNDINTQGVFKSFSGFSSTTNSINEEKPKGLFDFKFNNSNNANLTSSPAQMLAPKIFSINNEKTTLTSPVKGENNAKFLSALKSLNKSVLKWIQQHVEEDPCCILSPVFIDYDKHLKTLQEKYPISENNDDKVTKPPAQAGTTNTTSTFKFSLNGGTSLPNATSINSKPSLFSFGNSTPSFLAQNTTTNEISIAQQKNDDENGEEEEYVPPQPEKAEKTEEDALFDTRCKLFYKLGEDWKDRGVGVAYVKPIEGATDKFQLLIRTDNKIGTILLNIIVNESMPISVQKNTVTLFCVPNPPMPKSKDSPDADKPQMLLIRVKTAEMATEFLEMMNKYRGK